MPQVTSNDITVVWGDSDLYFAQSGFYGFSDKLEDKNYVKKIVLEESGHMVLLDQGASDLQFYILEIIHRSRE